MAVLDWTSAQRGALQWLAENRRALSADHQIIWSFHEPSWREYRSSRWYMDRLESEGFEVERGTAGMPTAFRARWSSGRGHVIAGYAEYDAVPGQSQAPVPYRKPRDGVSRHAAGHTDPHSGLGIGSFAGFLAAKHAMEKHSIGGTLVFFGEPAEKICGSKPVHAAHGYYDGLDAAISFHPHSFPALTNGCFWDTTSAPYWSRIYTFECRNPESWQSEAAGGNVAHAHATARAPGAIDAVCLMYTNSKMMKESMLPHTGSWTLNEFIPIAGQASADNIAPGVGQIQYAIRAPTLAMCEAAFALLDRNADHVAAMTHCTVEKAWITKTRAGLPNHAMAELAFRNFERLGAPRWSQEAKFFARGLQMSLGLEPMAEPFLDGLMKLTPPQQAEAAFRAQLPPWQLNYAADDYVEYTWHAPTVRLYVGRPTLQLPKPGYRYPEWVRHAMGGVPDCIDPMWSKASEVIATTILDLMTDANALARAQAEFRERTGGGVGGSKWVAPLLPCAFAAPIGYRWPEYVETPRGPEWTIPAAPLPEEGPSSLHDLVANMIARTRFPFPGQTTWPADYTTLINVPERKKAIETPDGPHYPDIVIVDGTGRVREIGEVEMTVGPALVPHLNAASLNADSDTPTGVRHFFLYVPAGQEIAAQALLEENDISYAGVRGFSVSANGTISIIPFVTKGDTYDHQPTNPQSLTTK